MKQTHTWGQLKSYVDAHGLSQDLRYQLDGLWYTVWLDYTGPWMAARMKQGTPEADQFVTTYQPMIVQSVRPRQHADGSLITKGDSGGPDDDPKMFAAAVLYIGPGTSDVVWSEANHKLYGLVAQVIDAEPGDVLEAFVGVAVGNTVPDGLGGYLAINAEIPGTSFGVMHAPQPDSIDVNGDPKGKGEREVIFTSSKQIPAYGKVGIRYTTTAAGNTRVLLADFLRQVPGGG